KAVLADFASFLQHINVFLAELRIRVAGVVRVNELRKAKSTVHARRPAADNDHVGLHLGAGYIRERLAKNEHQYPALRHSAATVQRRCGSGMPRSRQIFWPYRC